MNILEEVNNFLNYDLLRKKLNTISIFIAIYEHFKSTIIKNVKYFYYSGDENNKVL